MTPRAGGSAFVQDRLNSACSDPHVAQRDGLLGGLAETQDGSPQRAAAVAQDRVGDLGRTGGGGDRARALDSRAGSRARGRRVVCSSSPTSVTGVGVATIDDRAGTALSRSFPGVLIDLVDNHQVRTPLHPPTFRRGFEARSLVGQPRPVEIVGQPLAAAEQD